MDKTMKERFVVLYKDKDLVLPLDEKPFMGEVFPAKDVTEKDFDTYAEAKAFVDENGLSYKEH